MSVYGKRGGRAARGRPRACAFYDLDGTLADLNLLHATLFFMANLGEWSGRVGYLARLALGLPRLYLAERSDRRLLNMVLFESYKGISRDRLSELGDEYCERVLVRHLYPQAIEMLEANRAAGLEPVLVTGSPDFLVAPLARRLNIEHIAANRLVFSRGRANGRMREPVMAGAEKAAWCAEFAEAQRLDLDACWGYADSYYDLPFLCALGHPVAVNPDRRLLAAAHNRKWPIVRFSHDADQARTSAAAGAWLMGWLGELTDGATGK
ncbi:MAG TPA: HAD-IB family hydrolase [Candidatus Binataceae bacterium]|jgi:HAD superfamily hydrolase (TIGR01490 family)|nr:HAD-IB family hydrolase [Candidatus Binataceae bacterium]